MEDSGPRLRGALNTSRTVRGLLHLQGTLAFDADELVRDTDSNRVLKAALELVLARPELGLELRRKIRRYLSELHHVSRPRSATELVSIAARAKAPRGNAAYGMALLLSRLIMAEDLVDRGQSSSQLRGLLREVNRPGFAGGSNT